MSWDWDDVREGWARAERAVQIPAGQPLVDMRPMRRFSPRRVRVPIAITGHSGSGKTTLYEALTGRLASNSHATSKSQTVEKHRTYIRTANGAVRAEAHVPPGQFSNQRRFALDAMMEENRRYPAGVIHAVSWGFNTVWPDELQGAADGIRTEGDPINLATVTKRNRREELKNFEDICERLKKAWNGRRDVWLIIAVAKCDLYWPQLDEVRDYYIPGSPGGDSDFAYLLRELVDRVGTSNLKRVAVVPFSCRLDTYRFGLDVSTPPVMDSSQTSALVNHLLSVIGEVL
ncbi:hypothetical protein [Spirillospora sp. CA-294931]|uniref:hypothetical protein n=1 Tax=Spirillospora sp. CA-294931 TaxID=3240042 RepID=UPI003D8CA907